MPTDHIHDMEIKGVYREVSDMVRIDMSCKNSTPNDLCFQRYKSFFKITYIDGTVGIKHISTEDSLTNKEKV